MQTITRNDELRDCIGRWRTEGHTIALVPTMGNLHDGHLSLIEEAASLAAKVVVSIFVNPLQFGEGEDYSTYPRTPEQDAQALSNTRCSLLYAPSANQVYPDGMMQTLIEVGSLGERLCGQFRPGHFNGVATVVVKLLNQAAPDFAVFGQKDYQQLAIIRQVVRDLDLPVVVHGAATIREPDGLAMSSRNRYLTSGERKLAPLLYQSLRDTGKAICNGNSDYAGLSASALCALRGGGFIPDYFEILSADLSQPTSDDKQLVVVTAARLGKARLIDNLLVDR